MDRKDTGMVRMVMFIILIWLVFRIIIILLRMIIIVVGRGIMIAGISYKFGHLEKGKNVDKSLNMISI